MAWFATYLWALPVAGFIVGLLIGRLVFHRPRVLADPEADKELASLRCRIEENEAQRIILRARLLEYESEPAKADVAPVSSSTQPFLTDGPNDGAPDDFKQINGIGPHLENSLNQMGIHYYYQIAAWTDEQIAIVEDKLPFKGRIVRDEWRQQAITLAAHRQSQLPLNNSSKTQS